jgi:hypothetical protein
MMCAANKAMTTPAMRNVCLADDAPEETSALAPTPAQIDSAGARINETVPHAMTGL